MNKKIFVPIVGILIFLFASILGIKFYGKKKAEQEFKNFIQYTNLDKLYDIKIKDFDFNPFTREFIFKNVFIQPKYQKIEEPIKIKKLSLKYEEIKDGFIFSLKTKDLKSKYEDKQIFQDMKINLKYKDNFLEFEEETEVKKFFQLKTEFKFENFNKEIFSLLGRFYKDLILQPNSRYPYFVKDEDFVLLISKLLAIIPKYIEIEYEEKGFSEILLKDIARNTGKDKKVLKKEIIKFLNKEIKREKNENLKKILEAFAYFLENNRGKLEIEIVNKDSLSFQDIIALYVANKNIDIFMKKLSDKIAIKVEFEK